MRKYILGIVTSFVILMTMGASWWSAWQTEGVDVQYLWTIGTDVISGQQTAIAATDLDDTNMAALADANKIAISLGNGWGGIQWRFRILDGNDNDSDDIEVYVKDKTSSSTTDHWLHLGTLTILQGTQEYATGYYFVDTITDSNMAVLPAESYEDVDNTNGIAYFYMYTYGYSDFIFIASTLYDSDKIYIDYRRWSR